MDKAVREYAMKAFMLVLFGAAATPLSFPPSRFAACGCGLILRVNMLKQASRRKGFHLKTSQRVLPVGKRASRSWRAERRESLFGDSGRVPLIIAHHGRSRESTPD